ncbi:MAG: ABC transporter substrate-binding protein [Spirochaetaceae bacterium]
MRFTYLRYIVLTFLILPGGMPLFATGIQEQEQPPVFEPEEVSYSVVSLRGPTAVGLAEAMQESTIAEGVEVEWELVGSPDLAVSRILSGEADLVALPTNLAAQLYNRDADVAVAGTNLWGLMYLVGPEDGPRSFSDLAGRTVYTIGRGATPDVLLRYFLAREGLDPDGDLTIDYSYGQVELSQLAASGEIDLVLLPEPFVTQVTQRNPDMRILLDFQSAWQEAVGSEESYPQTVFLARRSVAQANPESFALLLDRIEESLLFAISDPVETGVLVEQAGIGLPAEVTEAAIPRLNIRYESATDSREAIEEYLQVLFDFNPRSIGGAMPGDEFYLDLR